MKVLIILTLVLSVDFSFCNEIAFTKIGTYSGHDSDKNSFKKSYFIPRYLKGQWRDALLLCKHYEMELATFETLDEYEDVRRMLIDNASSLTSYIHIDGMTLKGGSSQNSDWYWTTKQQQVSFAIPWAQYCPNHVRNAQWCLSLGPNSNDNYNRFRFDDVDCFAPGEPDYKFLCQKRMDMY